MTADHDRSTIGPYQIDREIGRGGMGVVLLGHDTRLDRRVALKSIAPEVASDPVRLARFEREARLLASVNHQNIAAVYGLEEHHGTRYLVMEFIEGQTLAHRLSEAPISVDEALSICTQIASAVEIAHDAGIIHRDLKPGNVMLRADGTAKVLDFGLAKVGIEGSGSGISILPTATSPATQEGHVLGTPGYMSPEQARGRPVDRRTDIFSFGCILYECLTGQKTFGGETSTDVIAAILERNPDFTRLPRNTPFRVRNLLERCLEKDPKRRLRDIGDARIELEVASTNREWSTSIVQGQFEVHDAKKKARRFAIAALCALLAIALFAAGWFSASARTARNADSSSSLPIAFDMHAEGVIEFDWDCRPVVSPDGRKFVYEESDGDGSSLVIRTLDAPEPMRLPNTNLAWGPFFSPDSRWLAYFTANRIVKVPVTGGSELTIAEINGNRAEWGSDQNIICIASDRKLVRIPAAGGDPEVLLDFRQPQEIQATSKSLFGINQLHLLPDRQEFLVSGFTGDAFEDYVVCVFNPATKSFRLVLDKATNPYVLRSGIIVFGRESSLLAAPFDIDRAVVTGEPRVVLEGVACHVWADEIGYSVSHAGGTLAYLPGDRMNSGRRIALLSPNGQVEPVSAPDVFVGGIRVSPDGRYLTALTLRRKVELWTFDLSRRIFTLISDRAESYSPTWSLDGGSITFERFEKGLTSIVQRAADGSGREAEIIAPQAVECAPLEWASDGSLLYMMNKEGKFALMLRPPDGTGEPREVRPDSVSQGNADLSPDGKWVAYSAVAGVDPAVFISRADGTGAAVRATNDQAWVPRWAHDGKSLYFANREAICNVTVDCSGDVPQIGATTKVLDTPDSVATDSWNGFDILPDGRFVVLEKASWERKPPKVNVIINWGASIERQLGLTSSN